LLAEKATFEEVAYLLIYGKLPTQTELDAYKSKLKSLRDLPTELKVVLQNIPASAHPMDVMRTGTSMLGNLEPEGDFENQLDSINRMIATMASIVTYWYKYSHEGVDISLVNDEDTIAGHFLHILHGKPPSELHKKVMDTSLILYAEHEFNASTFTARVCASTMSDIFSCVVAAIGSLRGPLHGGANEAAMDMIENWKTRDEAKSNILSMLQNKEKIMGFGHAVYSEVDPRNAVIKEYSKKLSEEFGDSTLYEVSEEVEKTMWDEKKLFANADFFHASAYFYMGIPTKLFTPIFVMSRVSGWTAHCMEQRANNRIIRPSADYIGPEDREWIDIKSR
jgi:2-methylcitrate synthase